MLFVFKLDDIDNNRLVLKTLLCIFFISVDKKTTEQEKMALIYHGTMNITTNSSVKSVCFFVHLIEMVYV